MGEFDPEAGSTLLDELVAGLEVEAARNPSLGVRYVHRDMSCVFEDAGLVSLSGYYTNPRARWDRGRFRTIALTS